ncbi:hypothetical protein TEA_014580 [Camellia sinensis var. sinensis]|uniref:DFDF domain-containing protein n=1 Tax=Camellia sinensis var. sinensis TaxID=542762 RepID=A0A4V3WNL2_CAMSN|nr:hypothetical protein TEA_014580 [Camellia sinensis var. sinensis]
MNWKSMEIAERNSGLIVKSFGTEGRRKDEPQVLPSDKIYEYIFFRGSDIEDLQVISSPPVQSTTAVPNDPAIIQASSSSYPPDSAVPATNISSNTRLGHPNSTFQGNLPLNQPVGSLGSWSSLPPPPTAYGNAFSMPTYWPRHSGTSGGVSYLQQQSLLRPPQGFPVSPLVQHQMQNPTTNTSLPGNASNFAEFSSPMLPTVGTGFPSLTSNMPPPLALLSTVPTRQSATLPSKLSPNLMPNNASNALPTVTVGSNSTLASPLTTSSLDMNPVVPPVMDKPKPVFDPALPNQTISQSMPSVVGLSSPVHSESSIPSLLTVGQLLQPGSTGQSSPHLQTARRDIEVDQTSTSESVSSDSKNANNPAESFQSPYAAKVLYCASYEHCTLGIAYIFSRIKLLHTFITVRETMQGEKETGSMELLYAVITIIEAMQGEEQMCSMELFYTVITVVETMQGEEQMCQKPLQYRLITVIGVVDGEMELRGERYGIHHNCSPTPFPPQHCLIHLPLQRLSQSLLLIRNSAAPSAATSTTLDATPSHRHHHHHNNRISFLSSTVCPTTTKFTEDFDFEAMNEKFNKEKIWGHLGKKNKTTLEDDEGEENNNDANVAEEEDEDGLIKFVMKDNFFDSLSCNSPNHELGRGRANLSEQRRIDIETFGEIPRHQRGHSSQGGPGWGGQLQGGFYRGRGYGYVGKGRGRTVWCRVT